jgi:hypothetical protein
MNKGAPSPEVERPGKKSENSPPNIAEVKKSWKNAVFWDVKPCG